MSLHYIIDGYNVIKQVSFLTGRKLRAGRDGLVHFIECYRPHGSRRNEVTVVFDGKEDVANYEEKKSSVRVLFSRNESADDKIKRMVEVSRNPKRMVVVSDDKAIMFYCRAVGARVKSVKEFLSDSSAGKKPRNAREAFDEEKEALSPEAADKITAYLKGIWLKEDNEL
ncbi:MAG: NYN domain-containing protein [Candidatus Omnitrophica bacterium]|nr:NYN domain-containing protein [Candidatus Omnitrophota bacterium]MBU4479600.1 NYN domain-containing protein [Candidatus Omnitrophota bacterium]MCG2703440.1 NYN domain-containing protein [Candidatus Omnitrophota bacterium]MCG2711402.1 NYN domain-containing protein [Candidatus Omnitrophota bacterium]